MSLENESHLPGTAAALLKHRIGAGRHSLRDCAKFARNALIMLDNPACAVFFACKRQMHQRQGHQGPASLSHLATCPHDVNHLPAGVACRLLLQTPLQSRCSHSHPHSACVPGISQAFYDLSSPAHPPVPCTKIGTVMHFAGLRVYTL